MDIRVVKLTDILTVHSKEYTKLTTPSISIVGPDLSTADSVKINGILSPSVVVLNKSKIIAQVPESEVGKPVDVVVYSYDAGNTRRNSAVNIGFGSVVGKTSGQSYLVQKFIKVLMTKKGSNVFNPDEGTSFYQLEGSNVTNNESVISALVNNAVSDAENFILDNQTNIQNPSAKLSSAEVKRVRWLKDQQTISVSVALTSESGDTVTISTGE
jgi:hypothetical protein